MKEEYLSRQEVKSVESGKRELDYRGFNERDFKQYLDMFDLDAAELKDKKVLDVGPSFRFQREAREKGVEVIGVEPSKRHDIESDLSFVKGSAQFLPFKEKSFDVVLVILYKSILMV